MLSQLSPAAQGGEPLLEMSLEMFKKYLDKIPAEVPIRFSGMCEPWLNSECTKMVLYAYKKGHEIEVYTTLVNMNLSDVDLLKTCSYKCFSIHLPCEEKTENIKIDDKYLEVVEAISKSNINVTYHSHFGMAPLSVRLKIGSKISVQPLYTRAANLNNTEMLLPNRKRGEIRCARKFDYFGLLPNGDVVLCCMDFGLKHILGNLNLVEYGYLFNSPEFLKIKRGLSDESSDILCRYCYFGSYADFSIKFFNYYLPRAKDKLINIRNLQDVVKFVKVCRSFLSDLIHHR